jgi:hypothetical protein
MASQDDPNSALPPANLPVHSRSFTTPELEAVIRRALELQANTSARTEESLSEADVVRIGHELGLDVATVRRAMAEVHGAPAQKESGVLVALAGSKIVRASRVVQRDAASVQSALDRHLRELELMIPDRRSGNRTRYERDASLAAKMSRITQRFSRSDKPLNLERVDVAVSPLDERSALVELSVDLAAMRGGLVAGVLGSTTAASGVWALMVWASAIVDPLMLIGIPAIAGGWAGTRAIYRTIFSSTEDRLESLLDRLEHWHP